MGLDLRHRAPIRIQCPLLRVTLGPKESLCSVRHLHQQPSLLLCSSKERMPVKLLLKRIRWKVKQARIRCLRHGKDGVFSFLKTYFILPLTFPFFIGIVHRSPSLLLLVYHTSLTPQVLWRLQTRPTSSKPTAQFISRSTSIVISFWDVVLLSFHRQVFVIHFLQFFPAILLLCQSLYIYIRYICVCFWVLGIIASASRISHCALQLLIKVFI